MNRMSCLIFGLGLCAFATNHCTQEPMIPEVNSTTSTMNEEHASDNSPSLVAQLKEHALASVIVVGLISMVTYVYYQHIQQHQQLAAPHPVPVDQPKTLPTKTESYGTVLPHTSSSYDLTSHKGLSSYDTSSMSQSQHLLYPKKHSPLHITLPEITESLHTIESQPDLSILPSQAPIYTQANIRRLSSTPPAYAHPIATRPVIESPTSGMSGVQTWKNIIAKLND